jgi:xanthine dehydrogenase YagR molybdenum-binding subunit
MKLLNLLRSNPCHGKNLQQLLSRQAYREVQAEASAESGSEEEQYSMYGFGAQFAEVKVDLIEASRMLGVFAGRRILKAKTPQPAYRGHALGHEHSLA